MIKYKTGNLFAQTNGIIAHGCNAQGVMGAGVAKLVKHYYPEAHLSYINHIKEYKESRNEPIGTIDLVKVTDRLYIANCITQKFYGRDPNTIYVNYKAISTVFAMLESCVLPIHIPRIGAGLANGDWEIIEQIINDSAPTSDITCWTL